MQHVDKSKILSIRDINKSFGRVRALQGVDLDVAPGEILGLIGDNGAGKSTLIKIISGFLKPDSGTVLFDGNPQRFANPSMAREMGVETVYQEQAVADDLTVTRNLFLGREVRKRRGPIWVLDDRTMRKEAAGMMESLRFRVDVDQEARYCSGGERQGIAIARAIHAEAKLVILDEPTNALGVAAVTRVLDLIRELGERGIACIFISHNIEHIVQVSDRTAMFVQGSKVLDRPITDDDTETLTRILNEKSGALP